MEELYTPNCSKLFLGCVISIIAIIATDYHFPVLPFNGIYLFLYLIVVCLVSIWITFAFIQNLLKNNKPLQYNLQNCPYLGTLVQTCTSPTKEQPHSVNGSLPVVHDTQCKKDIEERIQEFAADIEKYYIARWYKSISLDNTFQLESRILLQDVTRRFLQVVVMVDGKKILHSALIILLKHLKEYRRAVRRLEKGRGTIEETYRYSHIGSKLPKAQDYYIQQLTINVLRQFINWELWNSLPCRALVSILSRKVINYALVYVSKPEFINYQILKAFATESIRNNLKLDDHKFISLSMPKVAPSVIEKTDHLKVELKHLSDTIDGANTPKDSPKKACKDEEQTAKKDDKGTELKVKSETEDPVTECTEKSRAISEPVKIYESKSTNKTWRNSSDLECVSLGQDILTNLPESNGADSEIQSFIEKKLWRDTNDLMEQNEKPKKAHEDFVIIEELNASPPSGLQTFLKPATTGAATLITNTIKPIGNVTASIFPQSTVDTMNNVVKPVSQVTSTAIHKIGDLQDEAAGVMEGIFDFGMAGIRKGLRLTGLQENISEATQRTKHELQKVTTASKKASDSFKIEQKQSETSKLPKGQTKLGKWPPVDEQTENNVWVNPLSPSFDGEILLEKTPIDTEKSLSNELEVIAENKLLKSYDIPQISTDSEHVESPEPEYEEPADFASTIAKLRSLLQQKSSESNLTTPAVSPMPPDDMNFKTTPIIDPCDITEVDGVMPSLYKFCARTATGVFQNTLNTIKTALPGNIPEHVQQSLIRDNVDNWTYVASDLSSNDVLSRIQKLLAERREFCTVDTAYEAIDSLNIEDQSEEAWIVAPRPFDDELDDFEVQIPVAKALLDVLCELVANTNTSLMQESVVKSILLLIGEQMENYLENRSQKIVRNVNSLIGRIPDNSNQNAFPMQLEEMLDVCTSCCSGLIKQLLGEITLRSSLQFLISSFQYQKINQDIFLQVFELLAQQLIEANNQMTPAFSA